MDRQEALDREFTRGYQDGYDGYNANDTVTAYRPNTENNPHEYTFGFNAGLDTARTASITKYGARCI